MSDSPQYPSLLMIIRHGEKPGNPSNDKHGGPNLSVLGSARAAALPSLFTPDPDAKSVKGMAQLACHLKVTAGAQSRFHGTYDSSGHKAGQSRFPTPDFLFATQPGTGPNGSRRPLETITPLAQALQFYKNPKLTINDSFNNDPKNGLPALKSEILNNPGTYGGKVVLICWHHGTIPQLTLDFGVPAGQLPWTKWPATIFDVVFKITWNSSGQASLAYDFQRLLYHDSKSNYLKLTPSTTKKSKKSKKSST